MLKNAIKKVGRVIFLDILVKKLVIFPRFWAFWLVIFVIFQPKSRDFQEKSFGNTGQQQPQRGHLPSISPDLTADSWSSVNRSRRRILMIILISTPRDLEHFGNLDNEKWLKSPIFSGEIEFPVKLCISQLITLSFFFFNKLSSLSDQL